MNSFGVKSILDYSVEVDEAEDAKKEEKKAWTFKKVERGQKGACFCSIEVIIGCFCKIALLCNWALSTNAVCVFIKHILKYSSYKVEIPFLNVCILTFSFAQGHKRVSAKYE